MQLTHNRIVPTNEILSAWKALIRKFDHLAHSSKLKLLFRKTVSGLLIKRRIFTFVDRETFGGEIFFLQIVQEDG